MQTLRGKTIDTIERTYTMDEIKKASREAMIRHLDGTPNDEIQELAQEWEKAARGGVEKSGKTSLLTCADELKTLIEQ